MVDYLIQKVILPTDVFARGPGHCGADAASWRDRSSCAFRARTAPRTAIRGRGTIAVLRGPRQRPGAGRVDFDAGLAELVLFDHPPPGTHEGDAGDAHQPQHLPTTRHSPTPTPPHRHP